MAVYLVVRKGHETGCGGDQTLPLRSVSTRPCLQPSVDSESNILKGSTFYFFCVLS